MSARERATVSRVHYLSEILDMSWRHSGEVVFTVISAALAAATIATASSLNLVSFLLPAICAALVFEGAAAAWRVYRRQGIAIATTRSLLDLNAADLVDLRDTLIARFRNRERTIEKRHAAGVMRHSAQRWKAAVLRSRTLRSDRRPVNPE